jgi:hypothetical protein
MQLKSVRPKGYGEPAAPLYGRHGRHGVGSSRSWSRPAAGRSARVSAGQCDSSVGHPNWRNLPLLQRRKSALLAPQSCSMRRCSGCRDHPSLGSMSAFEAEGRTTQPGNSGAPACAHRGTPAIPPARGWPAAAFLEARLPSGSRSPAVCRDFDRHGAGSPRCSTGTSLSTIPGRPPGTPCAWTFLELLDFGRPRPA